MACEYSVEQFLLFQVEFFLLVLVLHNQAVDDICIYTCEAALVELTFQESDDRHIKLSVKQQDIIALVVGRFNIAILLIFVVGIEIDEVALLVGLSVLDERLVLLESEVFSFGVFQQSELLGAVIEIVLSKHAVVDEYLEVIPLVLKVLAVLCEDALQTVADFLADVA